MFFAPESNTKLFDSIVKFAVVIVSLFDISRDGIFLKFPYILV